MTDRPQLEAFAHHQSRLSHCDLDFDPFAAERMGRMPEAERTISAPQETKHEEARNNIRERINRKDHLNQDEKTILKRLEESILDGNAENIKSHLRDLKGKGKESAAKVMQELGKDLNAFGISNYAYATPEGAPKLTLNHSGGISDLQLVITDSSAFMYSRPLNSPRGTRYGTETEGYIPELMAGVSARLREGASKK